MSSRRPTILLALLVGACIGALIGSPVGVRAQDPSPGAEATPEASPTPGASPGTVDLTAATIGLGDLPADFRALPDSAAGSFTGLAEQLATPTSDSPGRVMNPWCYWTGDPEKPDPSRMRIVCGAIYHPLSAADMAEVDAGFAKPEAILAQFTDSVPNTSGGPAAKVLGTVANLGDRALGFQVPVDISGTTMTSVIVMWQRGPGLGVAFAFTPQDQEPQSLVTGVARLLDRRLASALGIGVTAYRSTGPLVPALTTYIPTPLDVSTDPKVVGTNLIFAAIAMILFTIAMRLLNTALAEREARLQTIVRPARWIARAQGRMDEALERRLGPGRLADSIRLAGILAFYGLVFSLLDRTWQPLSIVGVALFVQMVLANGLAGLVFRTCVRRINVLYCSRSSVQEIGAMARLLGFLEAVHFYFHAHALHDPSLASGPAVILRDGKVLDCSPDLDVAGALRVPTRLISASRTPTCARSSSMPTPARDRTRFYGARSCPTPWPWSLSTAPTASSSPSVRRASMFSAIRFRLSVTVFARRRRASRSALAWHRRACWRV